MKRLTPAKVAVFRKKVYAHYATHGRSFPWRTTTNPYRVLVSEIMLQQTQTHRVVPKYKAFLAQFPTLRSLANAKRADVLRAWQGLGYNRRALTLQASAQQIISNHGGKVPKETEELLALPGIGPYTAAAVRAFAFNKPGVVIETNIRTVFIHEFFPRTKKVADEKLLPLIEATLDRRNPHRWYSALMDYGVALKAMHGNASRRSTSYARQSAFAGSDRAIRGKLLALLLEKPRAIEHLPALLDETKERTMRVADGLVREGFAKRQKTRLCIA